MKKLCVIGDPVLHSRSPLIQNAMLRSLDLDYVYSAETVRKDELQDFLEKAGAEGFVGFNATMPHKESLVPRMDVLAEDAAECGSVNTVCIRNDKLYGFSTDGTGFLRSLTEAGIEISGRKVLLLGAGGAAKAVSLKLADGGAASVTVCNRTLDRAEQLCRLRSGALYAADFSPQTLLRCARDASLLVNCTSLGMLGTGGQFTDFSFLDALPTGAAVYDLLYSPAETLLMKQAISRNLPAYNGLGMLIHQAVCALEHFLDTQLDHRRMSAVARQALEHQNS